MNILQQLGAFIGDKISLLYDAINNHKKDFANPHKVTKSQVGLGNVDNTSDMDKPVSTLQSTAIGVINQSVSNHITNEAIHKTSEKIRSEIVDIDIPKTIVRDVDMGKAINSAIGIHDQDVLNHQDIRNEINNIKTGAIPVTKSEYAEKLGIEGSFYTKQTLDTKINKHIKSVAYDPTRAIFTFTFEDGTTTVIDTPIENTVKDGRYDNLTNELVLVLVSGQEIRIPAAGLIKVYSGADTPTSSTSVSTDGKISVDLKQGCIDTVHLSAALLESINSHQTKTGDTKDNVTTFIEASVPDNIISGEKHSVMFGKIKKWFTTNNGKLTNLASNPNITYATKEELLAQGAIIIPVDFTDPVVDPVETIKKFVHPFIDDGSFFKKPVYANYIWKTSYEVGVVAESRSVLVPAEIYQNHRNSIGYKFRQALNVLDAYDNMLHQYDLRIHKEGAREWVSIADLIYETDKTIFLAENGDSFLASSDNDGGMSIYSSNWTAFFTALKNKLTPSVYLKTNNTDVFIPASYYLTPNAKGSYDGVIRIEYVKDQQLWIEDRKFLSSNGGGFGGHGSVMSEITVKKIDLPQSNVYILEVSKNTTTNVCTASNPEILIKYVADRAALKSPVLLLRVDNNTVYYPEAKSSAAGDNVAIVFGNCGVKKESIGFCQYSLIGIKQADGTFIVTISYVMNIVDIQDYLKVSNIHIVTVYPTDLSTYPEGSIFIKQQV